MLSDTFDLAQVVLYIFFAFLAYLIYYLRREDRREGYPLESDTSPGTLLKKSILFYPAPKTFALPHGGSVTVPTGLADTRPIAAVPAARWPGAPLVPTSANPMLDGVGPGAYAQRADVPDMTMENHAKIVPLRVAPTFAPAAGGPDPRGYTVMGADRVIAGTVSDLWVDRSECVMRYLEIQLAEGGRKVLLPTTFADISAYTRRVMVEAIMGDQFAAVPALASTDQVTLLEEEKVCAYYGAGTLYATASRQEPLL
jgi:photosynthetic reaction center H subunit